MNSQFAIPVSTARDAIVPIGGPEDLSYRDAYARIAQVLGRRIRIVPIPRPLLSLGGVLAAPLLPDLRGFFAFFSFFDRAGYTCVTPDWLVQALGPGLERHAQRQLHARGERGRGGREQTPEDQRTDQRHAPLVLGRP